LRTLTSVCAAAAFGAAGLAGCSSGSGGGTHYAGAPTVTVWSWRSQDKAMWDTVQTDLAAKGTKVNIDFRSISPTSYDAILQTAMNGGKGPDIFYDRAGEGTQTYAAADMVKALDGTVDTSTIAPATLATAQYQGKTYGVPFAIQTMSVFYNKSVLSAHGVSVPTTWTGFLAALQKLKSAGITPMYMMGVQPWMLGLQIDAIGASTMSDAFTAQLVDKKANYTGAPYVQTLAAFQQLAPYLEPDWQATGSADNEQETALALGRCGFVIDGVFNTPEITTVNPDVQLGQFLVPSPNGGQAKMDWYADGDISLNANIADSAEAAAAAKVVAFTATPAFGDAFSAVAGEISPVKGSQVPGKYPLAVQDAQWYQTQSIQPIFGIRSPMDTPPPNVAALKANKSPAATDGVWTDEQNLAVQLLEGKLTPTQMAAQVQGKLGWYYGSSS
jgi:multiple sugar transport system substrate-binding protein/raffinose/stachyose/melibiose transport system substrate-binding protein